MSSKIYSACIVFFLIAVSISCREDGKRAEAEKIIAEWVGKEIVFPVGIPCSYLGRDTVCPDRETPYKIVLYTDSVDCTECKLRLYEWGSLVKEMETYMSGKVSLHLYLQPKDEASLKFILRRDHFKHAVYVDWKGELDATNKLPLDMNYHCFLLDKDNRVILIGNPTLNPKIWELYKRAVMGETGKALSSSPLTPSEEIKLKK